MLLNFQNVNVGPMLDGKLPFARRLNVFTGDNSLGKSFLLDLIWFGITRCWPAEVNEHLVGGCAARPWEISKDASLRYDFCLSHAEGNVETDTYSYDRNNQYWRKCTEPKTHDHGLVVYMMADGSFAIYDPLRNGSWNVSAETDGGRRRAYVLSQDELWPRTVKLRSEFCNGVVADWALWQRDSDQHIFKCLKKVVESLCPEADAVKIDTLDKVPTEMGGDQPTLRLPIGRIRLQLASSAIRRMASLAYALVWAVTEHVNAARNLGVKTNRQIVILLDEIESHLHPRWQRSCVHGVMSAVETLCRIAEYGEHEVQTFISTHSPLVMSSLEDAFGRWQTKEDGSVPNCSWLDFDIDQEMQGADKQNVRVRARDFKPQGTAENWLSSEAFDLTSTYSPDVEKRIAELEAAFRVSDSSPEHLGVEKLQKKVRELVARLPLGDPFGYYFDHRLRQLAAERNVPHDAD